MERCDFVNDDLKLIQITDGLTFGTDALLLAGYVSGKYRSGVELGSGSGIISLLLLSREKIDRVCALEVQEEYAELTKKNAELNGLSYRLETVCADARNYKDRRDFEIAYTNPPYMKLSSGKKCTLDKKNIARHEVMGDIRDFCIASSRLLKYGGSFYAVYRTDRLIDLTSAMRETKIEPKRMTFVHADSDALPSMALVEGRVGGRCGLTLTPPLLIYKDKSHTSYSEDMNYILEHGSFPEKYMRK
ncbi:MAG: methyltransferase [Clostridia bacterium]|nr:methyltransferase [Clostridia bacterium]